MRRTWFCFFFSSRRRHTRFDCDWSSDVCSSDLAAVFACPSVYEPFGLINLESMACETPVVASAVGGILEVVVDGETGLLVEPGRPDALAAALARVLENPALGRSMGRAGRDRKSVV